MGYGELGYHPPTPTLTPMKGPAKPLLGVIVSVSGNYVFSFLRNLDNDGHLLIAFNCNGKSFFVSGKKILKQFYYKCRKSASGLVLSRLCSATFEQLLAFGATFCGFSNLEQVLPFRAIFEQNIGLEHISSTKKSTISWKTSIHANFLKAYHVINLLNT